MIGEFFKSINRFGSSLVLAGDDLGREAIAADAAEEFVLARAVGRALGLEVKRAGGDLDLLLHGLERPAGREEFFQRPEVLSRDCNVGRYAVFVREEVAHRAADRRTAEDLPVGVFLFLHNLDGKHGQGHLSLPSRGLPRFLPHAILACGGHFVKSRKDCLWYKSYKFSIIG